MNAERDVERIVEYRRNPRRSLILAAWLLFAGALVFWLARNDAGTPPVVWVVPAVGLLFTLWFLWRTASPGPPVLELRPQGIVYRLAGVGAFFIPWQEIRGVDAVDFTAGWGRRKMRFTGMTAVLVSADYYRTYVHKDSAFHRGPEWDCFFRPRGELVEMIFHHHWFAVRPQEVRGPIEARWLAFRDRRPEALPDLSRQGRFGREGAPLRYGTGVPSSSAAMAALLVPVLGTVAILIHLVAA